MHSAVHQSQDRTLPPMAAMSQWFMSVEWAANLLYPFDIPMHICKEKA